MNDPGAVRHLWALDAPTITVDKSILQLMSGGENVTVPAPSFLIEHPRHGLLIFDTSLAVDGAGDPSAAYGELTDIFPMYFPEEYRLDRQLAALGFKTSDVRRLVLSHTHFDHTGGLRHFTEAEGFIGTGEMSYALNPGAMDAAMFRKEDLEKGPGSWNEVPAGIDHDLFGDGSVILLSLPGHTPGTLGLRVQLPDRAFVLTGDAAHLQENMALMAGMPVDVNGLQKRDSLRRLKLFASQPGTTVWVNHDPGDWATHRAAGGQIL